MSADLKVEAEINFSPTRFQQGLSKADASLKKTGQTGAQAFKKVGSAASSTSGPLNSFTTNTNKAAQATQKMGTSASGATTALLGMTQQMTAALSTASGLEKQLIGLETINLDIEKLLVDIGRRERAITKARDAGVLTVQELIDQEQDLLFVRNDLSIKTKELSAEQDSYNINVANMVLQIGSTAIFAVVGLSTALKGQSLAMIGASISTKAMSIATTLATVSMHGLRAAMTLVAAHPLIAIALVAATLAIAAYEAEWTGLRATLSGIAGTELPTIAESLDNLGGSIMPTASAETQVLDSSISNMGGTTLEVTDVVTAYDLVIGLTTEDTNDLNTATSKLGSTMSTLPDWYRKSNAELVRYNESLTETSKRQKAAAETAQKMTAALKEAIDLKKKQIAELRTIAGNSTEALQAINQLAEGSLTGTDVVAFRNGNLAFKHSDKAFGNSAAQSSRVLTAGLQRQLADNAARNKKRAFIRSAIGKSLAKEKKKQAKIFQITLAGKFGLDISDFTATSKKTDIGNFIDMQIGPKTNKALALLPQMLISARLDNASALKLSAQELQQRISQSERGRDLAVKNDLSVIDLFKEIDAGESFKTSVRFVGRKENISDNRSLLSSEALERFSLEGPMKRQNASTLSDMLSFMNVERFTAVGT